MKAALIILGLAAVGAVAFIIIRNRKPATPPAAATEAGPNMKLSDALAGIAVAGAEYAGKKVLEGGEYAAKELAKGAGKVAGAVKAGAKGVGNAVGSAAGEVSSVASGVGSAIGSVFGGGKKFNPATMTDAELDKAAKLHTSSIGGGATKKFKEDAQKEIDARKQTAADLASGKLKQPKDIFKSLFNAGAAPKPTAASKDFSKALSVVQASKAKTTTTPVNTPPTAAKTPINNVLAALAKR